MKTHISQFALKQATRGERRTKNVQIEFWRFAFAIYMIVYHTLGHVYGIKTGGYIGVDIFFMISGYFLAASHEKKRNRTGDNSLTEMGAYFKDRFIRLWPMYLCAYFLKVILWGIQEQQSIRKIIERIYRSFPEMFMLRINPSINGVSWFTCAMLLGGALLWAILSLDRHRVLCSCVLPVCAVIIYSRFESIAGRIHLITTQRIAPVYFDGFYRAFAGMSLGIIAWNIIRRVGPSLSDAGKFFFRIFGHVTLTVVLVTSLFKYHGFCDFWFIFLSFCGLTGILQENTVKMHKSPNIYIYILHKAGGYLGGLAYPLYLLHGAVFSLLKKYRFISSPIGGCVFVIIASMLEAVILRRFIKRAVPLAGAQIKALGNKIYGSWRGCG